MEWLARLTQFQQIESQTRPSYVTELNSSIVRMSVNVGRRCVLWHIPPKMLQDREDAEAYLKTSWILISHFRCTFCCKGLRWEPNWTMFLLSFCIPLWLHILQVLLWLSLAFDHQIQELLDNIFMKFKLLGQFVYLCHNLPTTGTLL